MQNWFADFATQINDGYSASSKRIARFYLTERAADVAICEKTDKGTLNQRKLRQNRSAEIDALYDDSREDKLRFQAA